MNERAQALSTRLTETETRAEELYEQLSQARAELQVAHMREAELASEVERCL